MNIPKKEGKYSLNIGQNTVKIDIYQESVRLSKMDLIGSRHSIGGYKYETKYDVKVLDADKNIVDHISTFDSGKYVSFISSLIANENGITTNPKKIMDDLYMKIQRDFGALVNKSGFNGIVRNKMKMTFYVDTWNRENGCYYDPQDLVDFFDKIGIVCKVAPKEKAYRAGSVWVTSVYVPMDFDMNSLKESRKFNKRVMRLTESDLHKIINKTVKRILNKGNYIPVDTKNIYEEIN